MTQLRYRLDILDLISKELFIFGSRNREQRSVFN